MNGIRLSENENDLEEMISRNRRMKEIPKKKNALQINSNCLIEKSKWNKVCE